MNVMGLLGRHEGQVVVSYRGCLDDEVLESVRVHGGRVMSVDPLIVRCARAEDLTSALATLLPRGDMRVTGIRLRRSSGELAAPGVEVA